MAASVTHSSLSGPAVESRLGADVSHPPRRRRIDFESGRALEVLGHAIEYLADEFVHDGASPNDCRLHAIQILMAANREIYCSCPETTSLLERIRAIFHMRAV
jgi:hypothetical protein